MSTLYLHIGTPKTGTTAIQQFLRLNRHVLQQKGYAFPLMKMHFEDVPGKRNAHFLINRIYSKAADTPEYNEGIAQCYEKLYSVLEDSENVILTDEAIWHACKKIKNFWEDFHEKVTSRGHHLKVIVYLRRQDEFIQSYWKYKVLEKETCGFMKYVKSKKYNFFPLQYYSHLSSIADVIGKDNIIVRIYEKEQYEGTAPTIISDFLHSIGLELTEEYKIEEGLQNTNVDFICTEIKRILNSVPEFCNKRGYIRKYMTMLSEKYKAEGKYQFKSLFMPSEQDLFLEKYEEENQKTAREWLGREDGRLFYAPVSYDENDKEFSSRDLVRACGEIISMMASEKDELEEELKACSQELEAAKAKAKAEAEAVLQASKAKPLGRLKSFVKRTVGK